MRLRAVLVLVGLAAIGAVSMVEAARSPLLQWREPVYIMAGFAGIIGLILLMIQPLLVAGPQTGTLRRRVHSLTGAALVIAVVVHVAGLWITSPPDVVDAILLRSPTPFAIWGVMATWAVLLAALLAAARRRVRPRAWRLAHTGATTFAVLGTVVHAWLIEGAMGPVSKGLVCLLVLIVMAWTALRRRAWRVLG